jgi:outer membrane protein TolC
MLVVAVMLLLLPVLAAAQPQYDLTNTATSPDDTAPLLSEDFSIDEFEAFLQDMEEQTAPSWLSDGGPVTIAFLSHQTTDRYDILAQYQKRILELTQGEFEVVFPEEFVVMAGDAPEALPRAADRLLANPRVDMIISLDLLSSVHLARNGPYEKPVLASFIVAREVLGIPFERGRSGVRNLAYIATPNPLARDIRAFQELVGFDQMTLVGSESMARLVPELPELLGAVTRELTLDFDLLFVEETPAEALAHIAPDTEAILLAPLFHLNTRAFSELVNGINLKRIPTFSLYGVEDVELGVLATYNPENDIDRLARRVALYTQRVLLGEAPETLPVDLPVGERLTINMRTAREIGFYPSFSAMAEADLLFEEPEITGNEYSLDTAIARALEANLDLAAKNREVAAGAQSIGIARSEMLPQVEAVTRYTLLDPDAASALQPERRLQGSITARQVIYNDLAVANITIEKKMQAALEKELEGLALDITQFAGEAYLNVLRAKTFERIQKDNAKLTRTNLELARVRQSIGVANPGEVYRWESELANSRVDVLDAGARRAAAEYQLRRIMHLPQDVPFAVVDVGLESERLEEARYFAERYLNNEKQLATFADFLVKTAWEISPELDRIDRGVEARERLLTARRRAMYVPTIAVQGEVRHQFDASGAGTGGGGIASLVTPSQPDTSWNIGLQGSLPLYAGGRRKAERIQAEESVEQLGYERAALEERLEQRVRTALEQAGASFATIEQSQIATEAARKNLELTTDAYSRGVVQVIDLLDAQNAALVADLSAAGALYEFYIDLFEVQRSAARFDMLASREARVRLIEEIEAFTSDSGDAVPEDQGARQP